MAITNEIKQLVKELDPIVGYDVYVCDCGNVEDCPPELAEVTVSALYDEYGYDNDTIEESPYGEEVARLWQQLTNIAAPVAIETIQFELVEPMRGQGALWEPDAWKGGSDE